MNRIYKLTPIVLLMVALVLSAMRFLYHPENTKPINNQPMRYYGEFGLYVKNEGKNVTVQWINKSTSEGRFEVLYKGKSVKKEVLKTSRSHTATFEFQENGQYTVLYGADKDPKDQYETILQLGSSKTQRAPYDLKDVKVLYAVGDTHGYYDNLKKLLISNGLMDENENWTGGDQHLIFLGDLFDRGHDVTKNLWMIYQLDYQAKAAGGAIHIVLGNHEVMTFSNDLRFISPKENSMAATHGVNYQDMFDLQESVLGEWLASKPSILKVDEMLFAHGGVITNYGDFSLKKFNDSVYSFMQEPVFKYLGMDPLDTINFKPENIKERAGFFYSSVSPYWYRGYVTSDSTVKELNIVLNKYNSVVHVVGHTPQETITQFHRGKLIVTDLHEKATEILKMTRKKRRKYIRQKFDLNGNELKF